MAMLFERMVEITEDYLGPAARRFVTRQVTSHLGKQPDDLTRDDVAKLTEWTKVTLSLLTNDKDIVNEYTEKMHRLSA